MRLCSDCWPRDRKTNSQINRRVGGQSEPALPHRHHGVFPLRELERQAGAVRWQLERDPIVGKRYLSCGTTLRLMRRTSRWGRIALQGTLSNLAAGDRVPGRYQSVSQQALQRRLLSNGGPARRIADEYDLRPPLKRLLERRLHEVVDRFQIGLAAHRTLG